jgi:hypothetical protein
MKRFIVTFHPQHLAHTDPNLVIERSAVEVIELPIFNTIRNKTEVIFYNSKPITD